MTRLLSAGFARLWKNKVFWIGTATMFSWAAILIITGYSQAATELEDLFPLERYFFQYAPIIGGFCAVFIGLFLGTDYSDGTIRNKVLVGHSRTSIYFSNLVVSVVAGIIMTASWLLATLIIGVPLFGGLVSSTTTIMLYLLISALMVIAFSAIFTIISMLNHNKAGVAVITILVFFAMLFLGSYLESRLNEPEMFSSGIVIDTTDASNISGRVREPEPNPDFVRGNRRKLFEFGVAFLPTGQGIRLSHIDIEKDNLWKMPLYSLIIIVATSCIGVSFFNRKDLK